MVTKDKKGNLEVTRGDYLPLTITATNKDKTPYVFQVDDIVRFSVVEAGNHDSVVIRKDVKVRQECTSVFMEIMSEETRIGPVINEPVTYWFEVEINPDTPKAYTIVGFKKKGGAKKFILTPESGEKK